VNDSRAHGFGGPCNVARTGRVDGIRHRRLTFRFIYSGKGGRVYHHVRLVSRHRRVDLCLIGDVALLVTKADNFDLGGRCPEKLDPELSRSSRDKRAHYSLRIWVR
jgi:hypothetical protein